MELDALDNKILASLDEDARMSESAIAKSVGTSKQVVKYRLKRLGERGIVANYYALLDVGQLGFDSYYIFVQLTGLTSEEEAKLYRTIQNLPELAWLATGVGRWDAVILFCAPSIGAFHSQLSDLKKLFGKHLRELLFTTLVQAHHISYKFLSGKYDVSMKTTPKEKIYSLDTDDKKILGAINHDARLPVTELAKETNLPLHVVHYRLKQLQKKNLIQGFRPKINVQDIGIEWHLLLLKFNSTSLEKLTAFTEYCKQNNFIYYVTNTVGEYDMMLDVHVRNTKEFRSFLFDLKNEFADLILLYESILIFEELLINYIPPIVLKD